MKHLETATVVFTSCIARQVVDNGVTKKYYRNNFTLEGNTFSVANPDKLTGQVGKVRFVKAGEKTPQGGVVVQDAYSLVGAGTVEELRTAVAAKALTTELAELI